MKLTEILGPECIKVPLESDTKRGVIAELVRMLAEQGLARNADLLLQAVLEREATRTTGIGNGLAIPHGKSDTCDRLVMAIGRPARPIDFESIDGQPVTLVVLLASPPDQTGPHIQALARISRLMSIDSFRASLDAAPDSQAAYEVLAAHEQD